MNPRLLLPEIEYFVNMLINPRVFGIEEADNLVKDILQSRIPDVEFRRVRQSEI